MISPRRVLGHTSEEKSSRDEPIFHSRIVKVIYIQSLTSHKLDFMRSYTPDVV